MNPVTIRTMLDQLAARSFNGQIDMRLRRCTAQPQRAAMVGSCHAQIWRNVCKGARNPVGRQSDKNFLNELEVRWKKTGHLSTSSRNPGGSRATFLRTVGKPGIV